MHEYSSSWKINCLYGDDLRRISFIMCSSHFHGILSTKWLHYARFEVFYKTEFYLCTATHSSLTLTPHRELLFPHQVWLLWHTVLYIKNRPFEKIEPSLWKLQTCTCNVCETLKSVCYHISCLWWNWWTQCKFDYCTKVALPVVLNLCHSGLYEKQIFVYSNHQIQQRTKITKVLLDL